MDTEPTKRHLKHEAARIHESDQRSGSIGVVDLNEKVEVPQAADYQTASYLRKTATPEQYAELLDILNDLRDLNELLAGEYTREGEVCLVLDGSYSLFVDRLTNWCESYFSRRLTRPEPRDRGDPFEKFKRLRKEYEEIIGHKQLQTASINYVLLEQCYNYIAWYLFEQTWKRHLARDGKRIVLRWKPVSKETRSEAAKLLRSFLVPNQVERFCNRARADESSW